MTALLAAYLPSLHASFQFDDFRVVTGDPRVHSFAAWWHSLPTIRPLLRLTYALGHEAGGSPAVFRAFNIAVHATNSLLLLALLRQFGDRCGLTEQVAARSAAVGAAIFGLHPIATEAVTYISGRSSALATLGVLVAAVAWLRAETACHPGRWRAVAIGFATLAIATKETAAMLPLALAAVARCSTAKPSVRYRVAALAPAQTGATAPSTGALVVLSLVIGCCAVLLLVTTAYGTMLIDALQRRPPLENLLTQGRGVAALLGHFLLPWSVAVELDLQTASPADIDAILAATAWVLVPVLAYRWRQRHPAMALATLWIVVWLLPSHSLFAREDIANDRQFYLPMVGAAWLSALLIAKLARGHALIVGMLLLLLLVCTLRQNSAYRDEIRYWETAVAAAPGNARAASNLGFAYAKACRDRDAARAFRIALGLDPSHLQARGNLVLLERGALFAPDERRCTASDTSLSVP